MYFYLIHALKKLFTTLTLIIIKLLNILLHKFAMEFASQGIVNEHIVFLLRFGARAIFENNIVVPPSAYLHIHSSALRGIVQQRISRKNIFHTYSFFFLAFFHFLQSTKRFFILFFRYKTYMKKTKTTNRDILTNSTIRYLLF